MNRDMPKTSAEIWELGIAVLGDQGIKEQSARALMGMWLRDWPETTVQEAIVAAVGKGDAKSYVVGVLRSKPKKVKAKPVLSVVGAVPIEPDTRAAVEVARAAIARARKTLRQA